MLDLRTDSDTEAQDGPSLYQGIALEVEQVLLSYTKLTDKLRDLKGSYDHKQAVSLKIAADDVALISGQMNIMASHISTITAKWVNRKAVIR